MNIQMIQRSIGSSTGMENHLVLIYLAKDQELWSTCSPSASSHLQKRGRRSPSLGSRRVSEHVLVKVIRCSSLRGGGGELGTLKT